MLFLFLQFLLASASAYFRRLGVEIARGMQETAVFKVDAAQNGTKTEQGRAPEPPFLDLFTSFCIPDDELLLPRRILQTVKMTLKKQRRRTSFGERSGWLGTVLVLY